MDRLTHTHSSKITGVLVRREIYKNLLTSFCCKFDSRYHVTISWYYNGYITILLIGICYNLCGYSYISFLFLMGMNNISAFETGYRFFRYLPNINLNFGFSLLAWKRHSGEDFGLYRQALPKILDGNKLLIRTHEHLEQLDYIKPVIFLPFSITLQSEIEIESVNIDYNALFLLHIPIVYIKISHLFRGGEP